MTPQNENDSSNSTNDNLTMAYNSIKRVFANEEEANKNNKEGEQHVTINSKHNRTVIIVEEDDDDDEDVIPGPNDINNNRNKNSERSSSSQLDLSNTERYKKGNGVLASIQDLNLPADQFAAGCNLLQESARGSIENIQRVLKKNPSLNINFRDYDRRTALHVASSEGHLNVVKFLVEEKNAKINRSDRWGGSPLDDAHRHRHQNVALYLRQHGATTGSGDQITSLITAAAAGDIDEVNLILQLSRQSNNKTGKKIVNEGDYDKRTALHLAAGEGHVGVVQLLCETYGANPNVEDRWGGRPIDDAKRQNNTEIVNVLKEYGGISSHKKGEHIELSERSTGESENTKRVRKFEDTNMTVDFNELEMIERIGAGAFGEIYKCKWRGTLVAAKCIKTAKIRRNWLIEHGIRRQTSHHGSLSSSAAKKAGKKANDTDVSIGKEIDNLELEQHTMCQEDKDMALEDFRRETLILRTLRHPNICLLLAYSTTTDYEVMISELMKCSLLDVFKANILGNKQMPIRTKITYAKQLALGMNYLHTCKPPVIHRDLKPANLLIDHHGTLKVADFGLAKVRPDPSPKQQNGDLSSTSYDENEVDPFVMTGETGSYRFMAPEVYRREYYTETVDVYSYAMIFYYLLSGRPPWAHEPGHKAVVLAAMNGERPSIPRDWDDRLVMLLKQCWDENYNLRPSFAKIIKQLDVYSQDVFKINPNDVSQVDNNNCLGRGCVTCTCSCSPCQSVGCSSCGRCVIM